MSIEELTAAHQQALGGKAFLDAIDKSGGGGRNSHEARSSTEGLLAATQTALEDDDRDARALGWADAATRRQRAIDLVELVSKLPPVSK
jgi:hypothetical protein